ncbi:MAG: DUF4340 domain-containing protein [Nitrospirota bacterium]|nr:DUF4340 domain-containing protein [Nitrospirota bacterium]
MSSFRKTLFWLIVLAAVGGVVYVFDTEFEKQEKKTEEAKLLFNFSADSVTGVELRQGEQKIVCKKEKAGWVLEEPLLALADAGAIEKLLKQALTAKSDAILFENPDPVKLRELQLEKPELEMAFTVQGDSRVHRIFFGSRAPTENVAWAMLEGDARVHRVHADVRAEAERSVYDLRDKTVLPLDPLKMAMVEIVRGDQTVVVEQPSEGRWETMKPVKGIASIPKVMEVLYQIKNAKIKQFIREDVKVEELKEYGLDKPRARFTLWAGEKDLPQALLVGDRDKINRGLFAKRANAPNVFLLEEDFLDVLPQDFGKFIEGGANTP